MRKKWNRWLVLGVLLSMILSLGTFALAAEDSLTILAVNGDALSDEQIAYLKSTYTNGCVLDVSGNSTSSAIDIVFSESQPLDVGAIAPEGDQPEVLFLADPMTLEANNTKMTLIGVNYEADAGTLSALTASAEGKVIAVGKADAEEAVKGAGIELFLTVDAADGVQTMVTTSTGTTQVVNVGKDSSFPIVRITEDGYGNLVAEPMGAPDPSAVPDTGAETEEFTTEEVPSGEEAVVEQPEAAAVCQVSFDGNGAESGTMEADQAEAGSVYTLPDSGYSKEGYTFAGWDVAGVTCNPGDQITIGGDTAVVAQWIANESEPTAYTLYFDGNSAESGAVESLSFTESEPVVLPENGFVYTGYTFAGWNIDGTTYAPGTSVYLAGDTTAYAMWNADYVPAVYNVTFEGSGAEYGYIEPVQVSEGETLLLPNNGYNREGYTFIGWDVNGGRYEAGQTVPISGDTTVYAAWEQDNPEPAAGEPVLSATLDGDFERSWTKGSTDGVAVTFIDAVVNKVERSADGGTTYAELVKDTDYTQAATTDGLGSTVTFAAEKLEQWEVSAYKLRFSFAPAASGESYFTFEVSLTVSDGTAPEGQDVQVEGNITSLEWTKGTDASVSVSFLDAKVASISYALEGSTTANVLADGNFTKADYNTTGETITVSAAFLGTLAEGTYNLTFTFQQPEGVQYNDFLLKLNVRPEVTPEPTASPTPTPEQSRRLTWQDRSSSLPIQFAGRTPNGLQIRFSDWVNATNGTDYQVVGDTIYLLPAMINGGSRWSAWAGGNGYYSFRVTFTEGDPVDVSIALNGNAPANPSAAPTATPVPGTTAAPNMGPTSPVTGDTTPIAMYVIILAILVAALAVVVILLIKRKRGNK